MLDSIHTTFSTTLPENRPLKRLLNIQNAINGGHYSDLGEVEITEESTLENVKIKVIPSEGFHANMEYLITIKYQDQGKWPHIHIDSEMFDAIKTRDYKNNKGNRGGAHKGVCISEFFHGSFNKNFKDLCNNKWEVYVYYLIRTFNDFQDIEPVKEGNNINGIVRNYKQILARLT
jgi:hypothetical protein